MAETTVEPVDFYPHTFTPEMRNDAERKEEWVVDGRVDTDAKCAV